MGCCSQRDQEVKSEEKQSKHTKEVSKPDQAGGHEGSLFARGDKLLKRVGPAELKFYRELFDEKLQNEQMIEFRKFVPSYFGTEEIDGKTYLVLENLLTGYDHANILDCKIGKVTWTKDHNERKTADQKKKAEETTTGSLGFRISGLVVKDDNGKIIESFSKDEGFQKVKPDNIHEYFNKVANSNQEHIQQIIKQTKRLIRWFKKQNSKLFFTASIFYIIGKNGAIQSRFIDFAHVYDAEEGQRDENVIQGLESVNQVWEKLL